MKKAVLIICLLALYIQGSAQVDANAQKFAKVVNAADMKKLVKALASKKFEGRESGTEGQQKAANFIRRFYKKNNVEPGNGDSYFQEFEVKERNGVSGGMSSNVLGYIQGTDKQSEVLVISAHYDHLGKNGKDIYYGADDDASGTAAIMLIAKAFAKASAEGFRPRRSILILNDSGEEKGLLGSKYYVENPVFPLKNTVADLNVDMIGRIDSAHIADTNYVYLIGSDKLSYDLHFVSEKSNSMYTNLNLDYTFNSDTDPNRFYYRSDHYNFAKNNIPVIFYFSGVHADYHQPTDTYDKILYDKATKIAHLVFYTAWNIANRDDRPVLDKLIDKE
jgi:Zn-dependent M28 family amino/carboxypeptidase